MYKIYLKKTEPELNLDYSISYWDPYLSKLRFGDDFFFKHDFHMKGHLFLISPFIETSFRITHEDVRTYDSAKYGVDCIDFFNSSIKSDDISDVTDAIFTVSNHARAEYFYSYFLNTELSKRFKPKQIWDLIIDVWTSSNRNCANEEKIDLWISIFNAQQRPRSLLRKIPDTLTVYRGGHDLGFSWSTDINVAKKFQKRNCFFYGECSLLKLDIKKSDVLFEGNREIETVISPKSLWNYRRNKKIELLDHMTS